MRRFTAFGSMLLAVVVVAGGCSATGSRTGRGSRSQARVIESSGKMMTASNNPTTLAGRGEPSLDDSERPAAWVFVDDHSGTFTERDGQPQLQWEIEQPVSASPTFRVEAYGPLLGTPRDFKFLLSTVESADGSDVAYAVSVREGDFVVGREYSLLQPGDNFIIRNWATGDVVRQIAPLSPGRYLLAGGLRNVATKKEAAAITFFTVGEGE